MTVPDNFPIIVCAIFIKSCKWKEWMNPSVYLTWVMFLTLFYHNYIFFKLRRTKRVSLLKQAFCPRNTIYILIGVEAFASNIILLVPNVPAHLSITLLFNTHSFMLLAKAAIMFAIVQLNSIPILISLLRSVI